MLLDFSFAIFKTFVTASKLGLHYVLTSYTGVATFNNYGTKLNINYGPKSGMAIFTFACYFFQLLKNMDLLTIFF